MTNPSNDRIGDAANVKRISELLERSSLGTIGARELRRRTDDRAARVETARKNLDAARKF